MITGVLESPQILNRLQLTGLMNGEQGATMITMPSAPGIFQSINTPAESFVPSLTQQDTLPREASLLQNGPDLSAVDTALVKTGAKLQGSASDPANVPGVSVGNVGSMM
jgi:hypothetical protein